MDKIKDGFLPKEGLSFVEEQRIPDLKQKWDVAILSWRDAEFIGKAKFFSSSLQKKYGAKTNDCALYHVLASSGMIKEATIFDFEGEDSIEQFILKCYGELLGQ